MDTGWFAPLLESHMNAHPAMEAIDVVKLAFQAVLGCGHLLADESIVMARIETEMASVTPDGEMPLFESIGPDYIRVNLSRWKAENLPVAWLARMMLLSDSATEYKTDRKSVIAVLKSVFDERTDALPDNISRLCDRLMSEPDWLPSHSAAYNQAYQPSYRVVSWKFTPLMPVLQAVSDALHHHGRILMCIDGPCGSGKSTLAGVLQRIFDAAVIPMDDFFTPHAQKTPERLAIPAGNADIERIVAECVTPWQKHQPIQYAPYLCMKDAFGPPIMVEDKPVTIIEGSYSLHSEIAKSAAVKVFLSIDRQEQLQRLARRDGTEMLKMFETRWIPLEEAYHQAFQLPDEHCIVVNQQGV
ncbi:MAG: hypothetical protein E7333_00925 [Clostridiales bacterium]|nr:hypothetical protein [Clostridiales bacterium]